MINISKVIKNIEATIDELFILFFGDSVDEYDENYSDVYMYELNGFFEGVENNLSNLLKINAPISYLELKNIIVCNWGLGLEEVDYKKLDEYSVKIIENSIELEEVSTLSIKTEDGLTDKEKDFLQHSIEERTKRAGSYLFKNIIGEDDFLKNLKGLDEEKYNSIIKDLLDDYIIGLNLVYKLSKKSPNDWDTHKSLHNSIVKSYKLKKSDFIF